MIPVRRRAFRRALRRALRCAFQRALPRAAHRAAPPTAPLSAPVSHKENGDVCHRALLTAIPRFVDVPSEGPVLVNDVDCVLKAGSSDQPVAQTVPRRRMMLDITDPAMGILIAAPTPSTSWQCRHQSDLAQFCSFVPHCDV